MQIANSGENSLNGFVATGDILWKSRHAMRLLEQFVGVNQLNLIFLGLLAASSLPMAAAQTNSYPPQLAKFSAIKEQQESQLAKELHVPLPTEVRTFSSRRIARTICHFQIS